MPSLKEKAVTLLSTTTVTFAGTGATTLFTVPTGKRFVPSHVEIVGSASATTATATFGQVGALTDFLNTQTLSGIAAANDVVTCRQVPNATPVLKKSYAAGTVFQVNVTATGGGTTHAFYLFGFLY